MPAFRSLLRMCLGVALILGTSRCFLNRASAQNADAQPPWQEALTTGDPAPFLDLCFTPFDTTKSLPQSEDLRQWFDVIAGQPQGIFETRTRQGQSCAGIEGIARLKSPWPEDAALKLAMDDYNRLQIHFFRGDSGVTFVYHEDDLFRWSAYLTARQPRGVTPTQWSLVNTDDQRNRRTSPKNHDHYELRCLRGEVILSRGDVVLLRAPLGGAPDEVFFQGKAAFHGIALVRNRDFPLAELPAVQGRVVRPAAVPWLQQLDEKAKSEILSDGSLTLEALDRPKKRSWSATPLPRDTLAEILLEIDDVSAGAGIYLGNGKDGPRYVLRYATDRRSKQLCVLVRNDDDYDEHEFRGLHEYPLPVVQKHHWMKLVFGAGQCRWWISPDGIHWAEPSEPIRNLPPDLTHIGLHCVSRQAPTKITLRQLVVRELPSMAQLAPEELRKLANVKNTAPSVGAWLSDITEKTPPGTDSNAWRRASAIATLAAGCSRPLANELLLLLANDPFTRGLPLENQLQVLADIALLLDVWDDPTPIQKLLQRYHAAGMAAWLKSGRAPFSSIRRDIMTTPLATRHQFEVASEELLRMELVQRVDAGDWRALRQLSRELRFFQLQNKTPLLDWSDALAQRKLPESDRDTATVGKQKDEWRELLIEELNKDVYNALAQLQVELSNAGREDASRAIAALDAEITQGIAPHWRDEQLLVSLPAAVKEVLANDSQLRDVQSQKYGEIARLRLQQAISRQNADAVGMIAWQFAPTEAAVEALLWQGDRALARGWFKEATAAYRSASNRASPGLLPAILPKLRLAATLAGQDPGQPVTGSVAVAGTRQSGQEFEKLVKELTDRNAPEIGRRVIDLGPNSRSVAIPAPVSYQVQKRARLEGLTGNDPNREFARDTARRQLDWVDRQLGIVVEGNTMFVSNRFHLAAYDLQGKQRTWQSPQPPGQIQFAQESPLIAARPLVTRDRIWARLLYGAGGTLACLDRANGQFLWTVTPGLNEELISDPFFLAGELMAFKLVRTEQQDGAISLVTFDPRTGYPWREKPVIRVRDSWRRRRCCEVAQLNDGIVATFGGVLARLDSSGRTLWLRKSITLPPDEDAQWITQWFQPPFVVGDRLFAIQPGSRVIECVDSDTGVLVWKKLTFDVDRLLGVVGTQLIAQTSNGLCSLDQKDGSTVWEAALEGLAVGIACSGEGGILAIQRVPTDTARSRYRPRLIWLDPASGIVRATASLPDLEEADPRLGPLVVDHDRIWTFWGKGQNDPNRDVVELLPNGPAEMHVVPPAVSEWNRNVDSRLTEAAAKMFPAWQLLHAEHGDRAGAVPEANGDKDVVGLRFRNTGAIVLGREISLPARVRPQLRMRFGNEPAHVWKVEVRFRGNIVWSQELTPNTHPQPWKNFDIDLTQLAGQEGWLTVRAYLPQGGDAPSYWKSLDLVF